MNTSTGLTSSRSSGDVSDSPSSSRAKRRTTMADPPEGRELDVENVLYRGGYDAMKHTKVQWTLRQRAWIFIYSVIIAASVLYLGQHATVQSCKSVSEIVDTWDGYVVGQISLIEQRKDLAPDVKAALVKNYQSHLFKHVNCAPQFLP
jgi:hypothetical protein